jgi:hypothetical protein
VVHNFPDGRFEIRHEGQALPYLAFDKGPQVSQGSVVAHKNLGTAVTAIKAKQARRGSTITSSRAMLAPLAGGAASDRLAPALAYAQAQQGHTGTRPIQPPRPNDKHRDISIGGKL